MTMTKKYWVHVKDSHGEWHNIGEPFEASDEVEAVAKALACEYHTEDDWEDFVDEAEDELWKSRYWRAEEIVNSQQKERK